MTLDAILLEKTPASFMTDLVDFAIDPDLGGMGPEDLRKAPPLVKGAIYVRAFYLATVTSGIWNWFEELHDDYPDFVDFLREIKADRAVDYIVASVALFPDGQIPDDVDKRFDFCCEHDREFRKVDWRFEGASQQAILKFRDYVIAHKESFQQEVEAFWAIRKKNKRRWRKK